MASPQIRINPDFIKQLRIKFPETDWMKDKELIEWAIVTLINGTVTPVTPQQPNQNQTEETIEPTLEPDDSDSFDPDDVP
jgi:hypothetical protein